MLDIVVSVLFILLLLTVVPIFIFSFGYLIYAGWRAALEILGILEWK